MNTAARIGAFVVGLVAVFGASAAVGTTWGPTLEPPAAHDGAADEHDGDAATGHGEDAAPGAAGTSTEVPGGLMRSQDGYSLDLQDPTAAPGDDVPLALTITGPDGDPLTDYVVEHGKPLHLIVVRRDLTGFQHVHPELDATSGTWTTHADLTPGTWRVYADFRAAGADGLTLGTDLAVPGQVPPSTETPPSRSDRVAGYTVALDGDLAAGQESDVTLSVSRDGRPVTDLQPYLGSYGHLVALRAGDLAYLHVHPHESPTAGPAIDFTAEVPSEGLYRLFLDFRHGGVVHTADFSVEVDR